MRRSATTAESTSTARGWSTRRRRSASRSRPRRAGELDRLFAQQGLSAPIGAVLAGSEAVVDRARTMLQRLGGSSVHKAGIAAAAALVALDTMLDRIADDHRRARDLARSGSRRSRASPRPGARRDNIVLVDVTGTGLADPTSSR